jgi:hypothetical protein
MPPFLTALHKHLEARHVAHGVSDDSSSITFGAGFEHGQATILVHAEGDLTTLVALLPVCAPVSRRTAVAEFFHRLNSTLHRLQWIFDFDDGSIACRHLLDPVSDDSLTFSQLKTAIDRLVTGVDGMLPAVLGVIGGGLSPHSAVEQAQASLAELIARLRCDPHSRLPAHLDPPQDMDPLRN